MNVGRDNKSAWVLTAIVMGACSTEGPNRVSYEATGSNGPGIVAPVTQSPNQGDSSNTAGGTASPGADSSSSPEDDESPTRPTPGSSGQPTQVTPAGGGSGDGSCASADLAISETGQVEDTCSGIQGIWYCYEDGVNSTSCMDGEAPYRAGAMCIEGVTTVDPNYDAWGAGIGLTLNHPGGSGSKRAFDADAADIVGFSVTVDGALGGLDLRIGYTGSTSESDVAPFVQVSRLGTHEVRFTEASITWEENAPPVDPGRVFDVQVQVVGGEAAAEYDVCVTDISPIYASGRN